MRSLKRSVFYRKFVLPTGFLSGTIMGGGIFALPYVFSVAGLLTGFLYLAFAAAAYCVVYLLYADIIVRTKGEHRFVGYARLYLGRSASTLSIFMTIFEMLLVMTIYLTLSVSFSAISIGSGSITAELVAFWFFGSAAIFLSFRRMASLELVITGGIVAIIALIFILSIFNTPAWFGGDALTTLFPPHLAYIFLPLGPILFAFGGRVAIPSLVGYFRNTNIKRRTRLVRLSVVAGTIAPAVIYGFFILGVLGLSGAVSEDAVSGLIGVVPPFVLTAIGILGLLSLWSSYIVVGLNVADSLRYDLALPRFVRRSLVVFTPLVLYFVGFQHFFALVGIAGGVFLALEGLFIIAMWFSLNRSSSVRPEFVPRSWRPWIIASALLFAVALVREVVRVFV
jgi:amino acid permease